MSLVVKVNEIGVSAQKAVVLVVILPAFYGLYPVILRMRYCLPKFIFFFPLMFSLYIRCSMT